MTTKEAINELKILLTRAKAQNDFYGKQVEALEMAIEEMEKKAEAFTERS